MRHPGSKFRVVIQLRSNLTSSGQTPARPCADSQSVKPPLQHDIPVQVAARPTMCPLLLLTALCAGGYREQVSVLQAEATVHVSTHEHTQFMRPPALALLKTLNPSQNETCLSDFPTIKQCREWS